MRLYIALGVIALMSIVGCQNKTENSQEAIAFIVRPENAEIMTDKEIEPGLPDPNVLLVEQAVDAWLYFNLEDYKSYEALIRSTEYDSISGIYTHHIRYRYMNESGGLVTTEQDFEVDPSTPGSHNIPYSVTAIK